MPFVLATDTVPGTAEFVDSSTIIGGGSGGITALLDKKRLAATVADDYVQTVAGSQAGVPITLTFVAPEELTLKNMIFSPNANLLGDDEITTLLTNLAVAFSIGRIEVVSGTGPNVGTLISEGTSLSTVPFTRYNLPFAPQFDCVLAAGDVLEVELTYDFGNETSAYSLEFTYDSGAEAGAVPTRFLSASTPAAYGQAVNTPSTGTLEVVSAPLTAGDTITLRNSFGSSIITVLEEGVGGSLVGVNAARTPGNNDFDARVTPESALRDEILAAFNDSANAFDTAWTFSSTGAASITVERVVPGSGGNADQFSADLTVPADLSLSGPGTLTGGTSPPEAKALATPSADLAVEGFLASHLLFATLGRVPSLVTPLPPQVSSLKVNGVAAPVGPAYFPNALSESLVLPVGFNVAAGDTVTVEARAPFLSAAYVTVFGK